MKKFLLFLLAAVIILVPKLSFAQSNCPSDPQNFSNEDLLKNCSIGELSTLSEDRIMTFSTGIITQMSNDKLVQFNNDNLIKIGQVTGDLPGFLRRFSNTRLLNPPFPDSILKQLPKDRIETFSCEVQQKLGYNCNTQSTPQSTTAPTETHLPSPSDTPSPSTSTEPSPTPLPKKPVKIIISQFDRPDQTLDPNDPSAQAKLNLNFDQNGIANVRFQVNYDSEGKDVSIYYVQYKKKLQLTPSSSLPPPDSSGVTHLTSCEKITQPGNYVLDQDLINQENNYNCFAIRNTSNVHLDCNDHTVYSSQQHSISIMVNNVSDFSIKNCKISFNNASSHGGINIDNGSNGVISSNTLDNYDTYVSRSNNIQFINNTITDAVYFQYQTQNSLINGNKFTISTAETNLHKPSWVFIRSVLGSNNKITNNILSGGSDGILKYGRGVDDAIALGAESQLDVSIGEKNDIVQNNSISDFFDCGIETVGLVTGTTISDNKITNTGVCGIGGWWSSSFANNVVSNNTITNSPSSLVFYYSLRASAPNPILFTNNTFKNNNLVNQKTDPSLTFLYKPFPAFINLVQIDPNTTRSNIFANNDFGTVFVPYFSPPSAIVDGGGNTCLYGSNPGFPLNCVGAASRLQSVNQQDLINKANQTMEIIKKYTNHPEEQLPNLPQATPTPTPEPLKLKDFNGDGMINVFDYVEYGKRKLGF